MTDITQFFRSLEWMFDCFKIELAPGECYPTEPYGEVGPNGFISRISADVSDVRNMFFAQQSQAVSLQAEITRLNGILDDAEACIAVQKTEIAALTTERDEWKREYNLEQQEKASLHTALNQAHAERDAERDAARADAADGKAVFDALAHAHTKLSQRYGDLLDKYMLASSHDPGGLSPLSDPAK